MKFRKKICYFIGVLFILLATGTWAWQSISQQALNEQQGKNHPGGRLHDDWLLCQVSGQEKSNKNK